MNLGASRVVLRPRGVSEVLDLACLFVHENRRAYLRVAAWVLLPSFAACCAARSLGGWSWPAVWALAIGLGDLLEGAFTLLAGELLFTTEVTARGVLGRFLRRLPSYLATMGVSRILLGLAAAVVLLLPSAGMRYLLVREASLLEQATPVRALGRSSRLAKRQEAACFGLGVCLVLAHVWGVMAAELLGQGLVETGFQLGQPLGSLMGDGGSAFALAGYFVSVLYVATARYLKYIDIRTRKEGWDIQLRFSAIAAAGDGAGAGDVTVGRAA
jgi:hypothetical protein